MIRLMWVHLLAILMLGAGVAPASVATGPQPPCGGAEARVTPAYAELGQPPRVATWTALRMQLPGSCPTALNGHFELAVALAGRFESPDSVADMAARVGAMSSMRRLRYWSVTDGDWRNLFTDIFAVTQGPARRRRSDFSAAEVLGDRVLYFAQDDSRSSGESIHALKTLRPSPDTLVIETWNVTAIRLYVLRLFDAGSLRALHFLQRRGPGEWRYYGLSLVRAGGRRGHERSFVNRAAAYYRHLAGKASDAMPPLAP